MHWIIIALLPPFLWSFMSVLHKVVREKYIDSSMSLLIMSSFVKIVILLAFLFTDTAVYGTGAGLVPVAVGLVQGLGALCYYKAISLEEVSRVVPLQRTEAVFVVVLASVFLDEVLAPVKYLSFILILFGGFILSLKIPKKILHMSRAVVFILASSFLFGVSNILIKLASYRLDFTSIFLISRMAFVVFSVLLFFVPGNMRTTVRNIRKMNPKALLVLVGAEVFATSGYFVYIYALTLAPVTLVNILVSFQSFFVLGITSLLSMRSPHILSEELNGKILGIKIFAIAVMLLGLFFIER